MFRFWEGGGGRDFHKHFLFYFVCVEYKDYTLIVKSNKMKESPPPLDCNLSSKLSLELFAVAISILLYH